MERTPYGPKLALTVAKPGPDQVRTHAELCPPGVTLEPLHLEYLAAHPDGCRYPAFCGHYRRGLAQQRTSMRQVHTAGEKSVQACRAGSSMGRSGILHPRLEAGRSP